MVQDLIEAAELRGAPALRIDPDVVITDRPRAFVAMPYGSKHDPQRNITVDCDLVYQRILLPALEHAQLYYRRADEEIDAGVVMQPMLAWLADADLVIADLQTGNFNVGWELGARHLLRDRQTLLIRPKGTVPPFDVNFLRHVVYGQDAGGVSDDAALEAWAALRAVPARGRGPARTSGLADRRGDERRAVGGDLHPRRPRRRMGGGARAAGAGARPRRRRPDARGARRGRRTVRGLARPPARGGGRGPGAARPRSRRPAVAAGGRRARPGRAPARRAHLLRAGALSPARTPRSRTTTQPSGCSSACSSSAPRTPSYGPDWARSPSAARRGAPWPSARTTCGSRWTPTPTTTSTT